MWEFDPVRPQKPHSDKQDFSGLCGSLGPIDIKAQVAYGVGRPRFVTQ
jgi:hypothetical protein